jgi:hypothetical protein
MSYEGNSQLTQKDFYDFLNTLQVQDKKPPVKTIYDINPWFMVYCTDNDFIKYYNIKDIRVLGVKKVIDKIKKRAEKLGLPATDKVIAYSKF